MTLSIIELWFHFCVLFGGLFMDWSNIAIWCGRLLFQFHMNSISRLNNIRFFPLDFNEIFWDFEFFYSSLGLTLRQKILRRSIKLLHRKFKKLKSHMTTETQPCIAITTVSYNVSKQQTQIKNTQKLSSINYQAVSWLSKYHLPI